ncbi:MAG: type 3 dihydrofolate reductase [Rheinheimera sp.]|nr:type 3 dihydrofolate reductase [Rheinheimera sp.]
MLLSLIAAMAKNRVIGLNNQMPWHMPADLAHFKQVTIGKPVVMGRKTFDSIGRLLPGRRNVVISRQVKPEGFAVDWVNSLDDALALLSAETEVMVIGGAELYRQTLPMADRLYLSEFELEVAGDAYFPDYHAIGCWRISSEQLFQADDKNPVDYRFLQLERER